MKYLEWHGLYSESWGRDDIVPEAYAHPAKYSRALIRQIYRHLLDSGYIEPGDVIADCFGGVALGAFDAMRSGLHWYGVELEEKFYRLGNENIELWNGRYAAHFSGWGTAVLLQGDSRKMSEVIGEAGCIVSSPPWNKGEMTSGGKGPGWRKHLTGSGDGSILTPGSYVGYGNTPGQLGAMKEGSAPEVDAIISSPPYESAVNGTGEGPGARFDPVHHKGANATKNSSMNGYVDSIVSSPPFENGLSVQDKEFYKKKCIQAGRNPNSPHATGIETYGQTPDNLGNATGDTFWTAAAEILAECYKVLKPGGVCAFVTGDYVRHKKRVNFGKQWLALCESVGFEPLEWITAWKREPGPVQTGIFEDKDLTIDRVSFFRRLANQKNPDNEIVNEDVIIVKKPGNGGGGVDGILSSPPYAQSINANEAANDSEARKERRLASGLKDIPYHNGGPNSQQNRPQFYGRTPGQLGAMPEGDPPK